MTKYRILIETPNTKGEEGHYDITYFEGGREIRGPSETEILPSRVITTAKDLASLLRSDKTRPPKKIDYEFNL